MFRDHDLELAIQCNRKLVNFLNVTLSLENSTHRPYLKDNNKINYVNTKSNHPASIIKQMPKSIELRLSQLSPNKEIFKNSVIPYNEAITKAGYRHKKRYQQNIRQNTTATKNRERNIIWFNPSYSANVVAKVGRHFLPLLDKHFPPNNKFHKIFHRNTVKISYSCMPNLKPITTIHRITKLLIPRPITKDRTCNCVDKAKFLLSQNCLINKIIYKVVLTSTNPRYKQKFTSYS